MRFLGLLILSFLSLAVISCTNREEKKTEAPAPAPVVEKKVEPPAKVDKSLDVFARYFEQADAIHREAWWVLSGERRPAGKSPFGKVQRALLSSQNIKLSNKSMFSCDRYLVKRDIKSLSGYPQNFEIFEKCSEKVDAKRIAEFFVPKETELQVTFFPNNLEEILGLGAAVLNKSINCTIKGNEKNQMVNLKCKDWSQDRSKEHMIRLDVYEYEKEGKNLIKLRGKVYENLSDIRKIEVDVPLEGKILVQETELYPAEEVAPPKPTPTPAAAGKKAPAPPPEPPAGPGIPAEAVPAEGLPQDQQAEDPNAPVITPLPVDPDVMMQRQKNETPPEVNENSPVFEEVPSGR